MSSEEVKATWDELAGRHIEFVNRFYARLFERYPKYRKLFPDQMSPQLEKMVEAVGNLALHADYDSLLEPYLQNIGYAHRGSGIKAADVENFIGVFIETLADTCGTRWNVARERAWRTVFDDVIVPMFEIGLERGRGQSA